MKDKKDKSKIMKKLAILVMVLIFVFIFCYYENNHLVITNYYYWNDKCDESIEGFKIVQISDLHNKEFGIDNHILIDKMKSIEPDIIVITGDIVDSNKPNVFVASAFLKDCFDIAPTYYVTGNHEYWLNERNYNDLMYDIGFLIWPVNNSVYETDDITIIGLSDKNLMDDTLSNLIDSCENYDTKPSIVLAHEPQYIDKYASAGADLVLTGHAHGGQFRLPFIGGIVAPDQGFFPKYTEGMHTIGNTTMIISRGLGNSVIPVRLFNDPEIVVVEFTKNFEELNK